MKVAKVTEPVLKREDFTYQDQYDNAVYSAELLAESYTLEGLNNLLEKDPKNDIYNHAIYLKSKETKESKWYEDKNNFPCCLVAETDAGGLMMTIVHYAQGSIAYDFRSNKYKLENSNWRRATKEEVSLLSNFKN